jgi:hypothetical protein
VAENVVSLLETRWFSHNTVEHCPLHMNGTGGGGGGFVSVSWDFSLSTEFYNEREINAF